MSTDVYERISSQIANEFESGARPRAHAVRCRVRCRADHASLAWDQKGGRQECEPCRSIATARPCQSPPPATPSARNMWRPDPEFWSANRAEHRFADDYELVAFDLPAANGYPATIGWELFGGLEYMTLVVSGQAASFGEAKAACEAALVQALAALRHPPEA
jgi:hypothetical protein